MDTVRLHSQSSTSWQPMCSPSISSSNIVSGNDFLRFWTPFSISRFNVTWTWTNIRCYKLLNVKWTTTMMWAMRRRRETISNVKLKKLMEKSLLQEKIEKMSICSSNYRSRNLTENKNTPYTNIRRRLTWPYMLFQVPMSMHRVCSS